MHLLVHLVHHLLALSLFQRHQLIHPSLLLLKLLNLLLILALWLQLSRKRVYVVIEAIDMHLELVLDAEVRSHIVFELLDHLFVLLKHIGGAVGVGSQAEIGMKQRSLLS